MHRDDTTYRGRVTKEHVSHLLQLHRTMVRIRQFEEKAAELLESGEVRCPTHLYTGQEAIATGVCASLRKDDGILGNHRSHGHYLAKGGNLPALMAELFCRKDGCAGGRGGSMHVIDQAAGVIGTVPMVAGTIPVAVGAALGYRQRRTDQIAVTFFGDSATEEGVFHEAVNFAAVYSLPVLFVCENNYFSSHLRLNRRRTHDDISKLVAGYGIPVRRVDGNDVMEVHATAQEAVRRARAGQGPTFLEAVTHRWHGHVGPRYDIDVGIRDEAEVDYWRSRCPILRLENELKGAQGVTEEFLKRVWSDVGAEIEAAVEFARASPERDPATVTQHVYAEAA